MMGVTVTTLQPLHCHLQPGLQLAAAVSAAELQICLAFQYHLDYATLLSRPITVT